MEVSKKQRELDEIKWQKSIEMGADACGTFDYCAHCDKNLNNPCEQAFDKMNVPAKKTVAKKATTKAATTKKTTAAKKTCAKKAPAKKATTKKK